MDPQLAAIIVHDLKNALGELEGELSALTLDLDQGKATEAQHYALPNPLSSSAVKRWLKKPSLPCRMTAPVWVRKKKSSLLAWAWLYALPSPQPIKMGKGKDAPVCTTCRKVARCSAYTCLRSQLKVA